MHRCQVVRGLARCECHVGYQLAADGKACEGRTPLPCSALPRVRKRTQVLWRDPCLTLGPWPPMRPGPLALPPWVTWDMAVSSPLLGAEGRG